MLVDGDGRSGMFSVARLADESPLYLAGCWGVFLFAGVESGIFPAGIHRLHIGLDRQDNIKIDLLRYVRSVTSGGHPEIRNSHHDMVRRNWRHTSLGGTERVGLSLDGMRKPSGFEAPELYTAVIGLSATWKAYVRGILR